MLKNIIHRERTSKAFNLFKHKILNVQAKQKIDEKKIS